MSDLARSFERYTYEDYENWPEDFRCELIDGVVYMMSAPSVRHQQLVSELLWQLMNYFRGSGCQPFTSPFDVRLFPRNDKSDDVIVQPDLIVVCDEEKLSDGKSCRGAPDLVIEILSDSTRSLDLTIKYDRYKRSGVREYWIVGEDTVKVCQFQPDGTVTEKNHGFFGSREISSTVFPGLVLKF